MPKVRVGDEVLNFPDTMSQEEIKAVLRKRYPPKAAEAPVAPPAPEPAPTPTPVVYEAPAAPEPFVGPPAPGAIRAETSGMARARFEEPEFKPTREVRTATEQMIDEITASRLAGKELDDPLAEYQKERELVAREVARQVRRPIVEGTDKALEPGYLIRPTRIVEREIPAVTPEGRFLTERTYTDPETGEVREPTLGEEIAEAFRLQTTMREETLRKKQAEIAEEKRKVAERIAAGEDVPVSERIVESPLRGILTKATESMAEEGPGVVETPLGATLRAAFSWGSAAAAEAYFRGLGYEVDALGQPLDPDDWAIEVRNYRESLGIPEVVAVNQPVAKAAREYGEKLGLDPESVDTLSNAIESIAPLAIPLPGMATERTTRKTTTFDPEGLRRVSDVEVPSVLENPKGFFDAEARRITENVAKGRTWADEYLDSPATRSYYARVTGDPDNAYIAGMIPEILIPGPEALLGPVGYAAGAVADLTRLTTKGRALKSLKGAKAAVKTAKAEVKAAEAAATTVDDARLLKARTGLDDAIRRQDEILEAEGLYDEKILRSLGKKAARKALPTQKADLVEVFIDGAPKGRIETLSDLNKIVRDVVDDDAGKVTELVFKNLPGDYVMLTDVIAVPRSKLPEAKKALGAHRKSMFVRNGKQMADEALSIAQRLPDDSKVKEAVAILSTELRRATQASSKELYGFADLPKPLRKRAQTTLKAAAKELGENPRQLVKQFDQTSPKQWMETADLPMRKELAKYDSWDDVPVELRRRAIDQYDLKYAEKFAKGARKSRDVTRAQMAFESAEQNYAARVKDWLSKSLFGRRVRARFGEELLQETALDARVAKEIERAGQSAFRNLKEPFLAAVRRKGNVDDALDELLELELDKAKTSPEEAWVSIWGHLYGPKAEKVKDLVKAEGLLLTDDAGEFLEYPQIATLKAVDAASVKAKQVGGRLKPDFQKAMLKVILENGIKKSVAANKKLTGEVARAVDDVVKDRGFMNFAMEDDIEPLIRKAKGKVRFEGTIEAERAAEEIGPTLGNRMVAYDTGASDVERILAESGEEMFQMIDDVPVRARADTLSMARDLIASAATTGRRNFIQRLIYGYIVPNLPVQLGRYAQMAIVPVVTMGVKDALGASAQAVARYTQRALGGGGLTDVNGVYYSPRVLEDLAREYDLGLTQLDSERVGSLAQDLMRDANKAAKAAGGRVSEFLNPMDRGFFLRMAEGYELNFRKAVFEMALARGDSPSEAAALARRSLFDYGATPSVIRDEAAKYIGESNLLYNLGVETATAMIKSPVKVGMALRLQRMKAEAQDPYGIHGDKALKSLGIVTIEGEDYYLPELPILTPIEYGISLVRGVDEALHKYMFAREKFGDASATLQAPRSVEGTALAVAAEAADTFAPAVLELYQAFEGEGEAYSTVGVPDAEPMTDEKAFWSLLLLAQKMQPSGEGSMWDFMKNTLDMRQVEPPAEFAREGQPFLWEKQPPEGMPHVFVDVYQDKDGNYQPLFKAYEPSKVGLANLKVIRSLTPDAIQNAFPLLAAMYPEPVEYDGPRKIREVFPEPVVPETPLRAAAEAVLPRATVTAEQARRERAEALRRVREEPKVE